MVWATDDNPARVEQMTLFRQWYRDHYHALIDIRIDPSNAHPEKVIVQSVAGTGPDLFDYEGPTGLQGSGTTGLQGFVESGVILDVTEAAAVGNFGPARFWPAARSSIEYLGRQYGVPDNVFTNLVLADADRMEALKIAPPAAGWKWNDLVALGHRLEEKKEGRIVRYGLLHISWIDLVFQNGGAFFDAAGTRPAFDTPETVEALRFFRDLQRKEHLMPSAAEAASMATAGGFGLAELNQFVAGKSAMLAFGRHGYIVINQVNAEVNPPHRIVPLPVLTQRRATSFATSRATGINRRSAHVAEALRFLEFLASREFNEQVNRSSDCVGAVPEYLSRPGALSGNRPPIAGCDDPIWIDALSRATPLPCSRFVPGAVLNRIIKEEIDRFQSDLQSPEETARNVDRRLAAAIDETLATHPSLRAQWERETHEERGPTPPAP
ncbi:extracellular solute-binding protein [Verrucomicrobium sp. GAS474]|uniref:ABC transporter substrate-binding protein n=1 Tax=Verrucomicrobium sp. GAS474 TaxID=1882831 RepID=UPI0012FF97F3|nr:extracellular solute-binding protein [Verrucomicrobium sp. GAS474]